MRWTIAGLVIFGLARGENSVTAHGIDVTQLSKKKWKV